MDERTLAFARELEGRDDALAGSIERVEALLDEVERVGDRAAELVAELVRAPGREQAAEAAEARAEEQLAAAREDAGRARAERLDAEPSGDDRLFAAHRREERALDGVQRAEERLARGRSDAGEARRLAEAARDETSALERRAAELAVAVAAVPRLSREGGGVPEPGLDGLARWASHARAALWVVRSGLQNERERVVREANELAASELGETAGATSVAGVLARLERAG